MSARNATDAVMAVLDDARVQAWIGDRQYDALCAQIERVIAEHAIAAKDAEIARLREEIAQLCGYDNVQEMDSEASRSALAGGGGA